MWALIVLAILVAAIIIRRYYIVSDSNVAILRSGLRGARVFVSKGALVLPFLQHADFIPLRTINIGVRIADDKALLTSDQLRIDLHINIDVRVNGGSTEDIQRAARTIGARQLNEDDLTTLLGGRLTGLVRNIGATYSFNDLHFKRDEFCGQVRKKAAELTAENGLLIDAVAVVHLDQTEMAKLSDQNIMDSEGLSQITRLTSEKRKERAQIEADATAEIRRTELSLVERQLDMDRQQEAAKAKTEEDIAKLQSDRDLHLAQTREKTEQQSAEVRIKREEAVRQAEINKDLTLRNAEIKSLNEVETAKITASITLSEEQKKQIKADVALEGGRAELMRTQEGVQTERERLVAERAREQHVLKAEREREGDIIRTDTEAGNTMKIAKAEADAHLLRQAAEAEAAAGIISAENTMDDRVIAMKLEEHKIKIMPEMASHMSKSLEKIEGIRINMLGGLPGQGQGGGGGGSAQTVFSSAIEDILAMTVQLPALQKIGEQIGVDMDAPVATRISDAAARVRPQETTGSASVAGENTDGKKPKKQKKPKKPKGEKS